MSRAAASCRLDFQYIENQAEFFTTLRRRPHVLAINNTNVLNDSTVLTLRYGWQTWQDQTDSADVSPGPRLARLQLRLCQRRSTRPAATMFPELLFDEIDDVGGWGGDRTRWTGPYAINGTLTKLMGAHSIKAGADFRQLGIKATTEVSANTGGARPRRQLLVRSTVHQPQRRGRPRVREPAARPPGRRRRALQPRRRRVVHALLRRLRPGRLARELEAHAQLRRAVRARRRVARNREPSDRRLRSDRRRTLSTRSCRRPAPPLAGRTLRGGLIFAGVDGAPEEQGDPPAIKVAPRVGVTYAANPRTVLRGGYGMFYAPWQYNATNHGQIGFARTTSLSQSSAESDVPITTLDNPFPGGLQQPIGSSLGLLTGVGGDDQLHRSEQGRAHRPSVLVRPAARAAGDMARHHRLHGRDRTRPGIRGHQQRRAQHQPDRSRPGAAAVPGRRAAGGTPRRCGSRSAIRSSGSRRPANWARARRCRSDSCCGHSRSSATSTCSSGPRAASASTTPSRLVLDKRLTRSWWGGRYSYTWSRLEDNQFGEDSAYQTRTATPQNVYDLDAEYSISNFDSPHRIILAPIVRFPDPAQHTALLGGWTRRRSSSS